MDQLDVHPRIINSLKKARLSNIGTILGLSIADLQRCTPLSVSDIKQLQTTAAQSVLKTPPTTALKLYDKTGPTSLLRLKLSTGCKVLDKFLKGGFLSRVVSEISGESASGKTQLCMQLCLTVQLTTELGGLEAGAVYVCTEDVFPNKRLMQMISLLKQRCSDPHVKRTNFADNIFIEHASSLEDLWFCISRKLPVLLEQGRVKLIVLDSVTALFRGEFDIHNMMTRAKEMRKLATQLLSLSTQYNIPVICVNQVSDVIRDTPDISSHQGRKFQPALGISWANLVTVRLMLSRTARQLALAQRDSQGAVASSCHTPVRSMEVLFAPHLPNQLCHYIVDEHGVKGLPDE